MALPGVKLDDGNRGFATNCFPVRTLLSAEDEGGGAWLVAHKAEQRRRFKAVLCARPRTYSQIREERKRAQKEETDIVPPPMTEREEPDEAHVLDGFFLMKHCCVDDPADLCSINISGQGLSDVKEDDFVLFDNVAYVNAAENILPLEAFRGFQILRELEMPLNGLRGLKLSAADFPNLEMLDLSYNNLCPDDLLPLGVLPKLRVLHLTGNGLRQLPTDLTRPHISERGQQLARFPALEILQLDDNALADLSTFAALAGLRKLKQLNLDKNEIYSVPQLMLVEGRHVMTQSGSYRKGPKSKSQASSRKSKSPHRKTPGMSLNGESPMKEFETGSVGVLGPPPSLRDLKADVLEDSGRDVIQEEENAETKHVSTDTAQDTPPAGRESQVTDPEPAQVEAAPKEEMTPDPVTAAASEPALEDFNLESLDLGELSLDDLDKKISEQAIDSVASEREMNMLTEGTSEPMPPPFPELQSLSLAYNQIHDEESLLAVAAWPMLSELIIHHNPLTMHHSGMPPLLKRFLSDRLGISLVRKEPGEFEKPPIEVPQKSGRKVSSLVPRVPKRNIDDILLAIEGPKPAPPTTPANAKLPPLDSTKPLPPITPDPTAEAEVEGQKVKEQDGDAFFMTQVDEQEPEKVKPATPKKSSRGKGGQRKAENAAERELTDKYKGYECLMDVEDDPMTMLPKDIQGSVQALQYTLNHPIVYRDPYVRLDKPQPPHHPYIKRRMPDGRQRKTKPEKMDQAVRHLKERSTVVEAGLDQVLKEKKMNKDFSDAPKLLQQIQHRYNKVRATSMKDAKDARNTINEVMKETDATA